MPARFFISNHNPYAENLVSFIRRYWSAGLIMVIVAVHAAVIGYVRNRVAQLNSIKSPAIEIGSFRFQPVEDLSRVYHFRLHAVVDPAQRHQAEERLTQMQVQIREASEQMLRQVDQAWLQDPSQQQVRQRLMDVVASHLPEPLVQRILITDWLELPVRAVDVDLLPAETIARR